MHYTSTQACGFGSRAQLRYLLYLLTVLTPLALVACGVSQPLGPTFESSESGKLLSAYREITTRERLRRASFLQIVGSDIELPPTSGADEPSDNRLYDFYVWAHQLPLDGDLGTLLHYGDLQIDVIGVKAELLRVTYGPDFAPNGVLSEYGYQELTPSSTDEEASDRNNPETASVHESAALVRIVIDSNDVSRSFQIVAHFPNDAQHFENRRAAEMRIIREKLLEARKRCKPDDCKDAERLARRLEEKANERNPYQAVRKVRVFNGDLHTRIYMLSDAEVVDAFGPNFGRAFFVGRAYFRNRHADKKLIVNTTSLRARTIFYREPVSVDVSADTQEEVGKILESYIVPLTVEELRNLAGEFIAESRTKPSTFFLDTSSAGFVDEVLRKLYGDDEERKNTA